ncbi:MAG: hypothetical protein IJK96_05220 [Bacteroidales bacterium]|nr:hypothetical protein [Bacteroidales bacterium]
MVGFQIDSAEAMERAVREMGIVPFFRNRIPGFSIQDMTKPGFWFDGEEDTLGPWDWKIECVRSGDIAYGKFLCGGKASFATTEWYRELMNYQRSRLFPDNDGQLILQYISEHGSISIKEVRALLGVKKTAADAAIGRLQRQCRVVTGDLTRVYRGPDLKYSGWQVASFCRPEDLFSADASFSSFTSLPGFPFAADSDPLHTDHTPEESLEALVEHVRTILPARVRREDILKVFT